METQVFSTWEKLSQLSGTRSASPDTPSPDGPFKALMGWDGVVVRDDSVDPVDLLRAYIEKVKQESCGQCVPCRLGTEELHRIMTRICGGGGLPEDLETVEFLARYISDAARCDVGRSLGRPVLDLITHYRELLEATIQDQRTVPRGKYTSLVTAPCMNACPSHVDIPAYLEGIRMGRFDEALATVRKDCPMPGTIGRVCVRPCESNCRRGLMDSPLAIRALKRFLADREISFGKAPAALSPTRSQQVAIVGAGPAGLSCAYYLGRRGYRTTIFEAQEGPGGMAAYGIPAYRLPRNILAYEAALVEKQGAEIRYGVKVGQDVTVAELRDDGYQAVFIGVGAPESSKMYCTGEDAGYECFMNGTQFLAETGRGRIPIQGDKLVVVGGGNVAMDCVRSALRIGFTDVNLLYRRTEAEMPADPQEIVEAKEEGVKFHYLVAPVSVVSRDGRVVGLECRRMELGEPDASGRRRPMPVDGSEFVMDCDAIIPAVGQICVVDCVLPDSQGVTPRKTLVVDQITFQSTEPHLFGGGDCVTGPATLIAALAAGKKAARYIAQYLEQGLCRPDPPELLEKLFNDQGVFDPKEKFPFPGRTHQAEPEVMAPEERIKSFDEVEGSLPLHLAVREASRCLRCYRIAVAAV